MIKGLFAGIVSALVLAGCASVAKKVVDASHSYPEARSFAVSDDAERDVDAALARAGAADKRVLLVMGANWCHDSRALAGWLESERIAPLVADKYELVYVNVGFPQQGDGHNLGIAKRFGLNEFPGTPALLVVTPDGRLMNRDTASSWRNAASRSEDAIYDELAKLAEATPPAAQ